MSEINQLQEQKETKFTCKCPNIWTSKGKLLRGESIKVSPEEKKELEAAQEKILDRILSKANVGEA